MVRAMSHRLAFLTILLTCRRVAGSPPRRAGNFSLSCQRKVTKREALNCTPAPDAIAGQVNSHSAAAQKRPAALSRLTCHDRHPSHLQPVRRAAARRAHQNSQRQRRSGAAPAGQHPPGRRPSDAVLRLPGEHGVQPALSGVKVRSIRLVTGTAARAQRLASVRNSDGCSRALLMAASGWLAVERLFFGDFLLARQKKVTPPPGGTPGNLAANPVHQ